MYIISSGHVRGESPPQQAPLEADVFSRSRKKKIEKQKRRMKKKMMMNKRRRGGGGGGGKVGKEDET